MATVIRILFYMMSGVRILSPDCKVTMLPFEREQGSLIGKSSSGKIKDFGHELPSFEQVDLIQNCSDTDPLF